MFIYLKIGDMVTWTYGVYIEVESIEASGSINEDASFSCNITSSAPECTFLFMPQRVDAAEATLAGLAKMHDTLYLRIAE